jgi:putative ABC transport system permease protein
MIIDFMHQFLELAPTAITQALVLAILAMGVMIPFRLLNFPDLTSEGSYPMGGALCASLLIANLDPISSALIAAILGGVLGIGTAYLHLKWKVNSLLAGIILSTMVYSLNLRFMGKPNIHLFDHANLFQFLGDSLYSKMLFLILIHLVIFTAIYTFLRTQKGLRLRAIGYNPSFAEKLGANLTFYIMAGLFVSNALNSLGGALMVQMQQYADIGMGIGIVIHALAALMIGETILGVQINSKNYMLKQLLAPLIGALLYEQIRSFAIALGLPPSDHKFVTGAIVITAIALRRKTGRLI